MTNYWAPPEQGGGPPPPAAPPKNASKPSGLVGVPDSLGSARFDNLNIGYTFEEKGTRFGRGAAVRALPVKKKKESVVSKSIVSGVTKLWTLIRDFFFNLVMKELSSAMRRANAMQKGAQLPKVRKRNLLANRKK